MPRRLRLRREALAELTTDDLVYVVAAAASADCLRDLSRKLGCVGTYQCPTYTC